MPLGALSGRWFGGDGLVPTHRLALQDQAITVVNEAIEDRIGDGAITEVSVPPIDRQLAGDQGRAAIIAIWHSPEIPDLYAGPVMQPV